MADINRFTLFTACVLAAAPFAMRADDAPENSDRIDNPNRFSLGARFGFNFKASFRNNGGATPASSGSGGTYVDGYVHRDASGDAGGLTSNWGYKNASQVVGDTMQFHAVQSTGASGSGGNSRATDDPQYGTELSYQRVIGRLPMVRGWWGLEAAFGWTDLDLRENRNANGTVTPITDAYQLNGVVPPLEGYNGTSVGPGPLLGDTATRTLGAPMTASVMSQQKLSGQLYTIRVGPFAEWNMTHCLSLSGSVGLTLAPSRVDYDFLETSTLSGSGSTTVSGHSSKSDLLYGPYVGATLRYDINKSWGVYVGAQFQSLTDLEQSAGSRTARLDQSATVYATAGLSFKF